VCKHPFRNVRAWAVDDLVSSYQSYACFSPVNQMMLGLWPHLKPTNNHQSSPMTAATEEPRSENETVFSPVYLI